MAKHYVIHIFNLCNDYVLRNLWDFVDNLECGFKLETVCLQIVSIFKTDFYKGVFDENLNFGNIFENFK